MLPDGSQFVCRELERRSKLRDKDHDVAQETESNEKGKKDKDKGKTDKSEKPTGDKWKSLHMELAEKRNSSRLVLVEKTN